MLTAVQANLLYKLVFEHILSIGLVTAVYTVLVVVVAPYIMLPLITGIIL